MDCMGSNSLCLIFCREGNGVKKRLLINLCSTVLMATVAAPIYAQNNTAVNQAQMAKIAARADQLEQEVTQLRQQLAAMQQHSVPATARASGGGDSDSDDAALPAARKASAQATGADTAGVAVAQHTAEELPKAAKNMALMDRNRQARLFTIGSSVTTSPYLSIRQEFDGSDMVVNSASVNEDLFLLRRRQAADKAYDADGLPEPQVPVVIISGALEGQAWHANPYTGGPQSDIDFTRGQLDVLGQVNPWAMGFFSFGYDSGAKNNSSRINNSNLHVSRAYLTVGNLNKAPVYGTVGQFYVPFGRYSAGTASDPLPKLLGRTNARALALGYKQAGDNGFYGAIYGFRGDSVVNGRGSRVNEGGANLGYEFDAGNYHGVVSAGAISNLTDSQGLQALGTNASGDPIGYTSIQRRVPAVNVNAALSNGPFDLLLEYVGAARKFDANDMLYNSATASPYAYSAELDYSSEFVMGKPTTLAFSYGHTGKALAFSLPRDRFMAALNVSFVRDTIATLEYRMDRDYKAGSTGTAAGITSNSGTGKKSHTLTAQMGVYF